MYYPKFFKRLVSSLIIGGQAINYIFKGKISKNDLFEQLMESGPGSLLIVLITGIAAGTVFNIQVASQLTSMGVSSEIGGLLAVGMAREMAPLLTATLMTGKVATAYAAQLGTMKVTEQIEAITMLRTEPVQYLVVPRLLSMIIKSVVFGLLISIIACGYGLTTNGGPKEVGTSTTGAVVMTLVTVSLVDVVLTQILFG